MHELTVTAVGADRPGIVASVTGVLFELGCNLADCSMSLLRDQFAMILLVEAPDDVPAERLLSSLKPVTTGLSLELVVHEASHESHDHGSSRSVISIYGADKPGIVHKVSSWLAERSINITDLVSRAGGDVYTMLVDVELPHGSDPEQLASDLLELGRQIDVEVSMRASEADSL